MKPALHGDLAVALAINYFSTMNQTQPNNPLHGVTLEHVVSTLVERFGWEALGQRIKIRCFTHEPSIKSSLKFLRKTAWAREKVEQLYLSSANKRSPWG